MSSTTEAIAAITKVQAVAVETPEFSPPKRARPPIAPTIIKGAKATAANTARRRVWIDLIAVHFNHTARRPAAGTGAGRFQRGNCAADRPYLIVMPTYEYACTKCDLHLEVYQSFTDEPLSVCEVCGGKLRRVIHPAGLVFKGTGFYSTDSRRAAAKRSGDRPSEKPAAKKDGGSSGSESKKNSGDSGSATKQSKPA